MSGDRSGNLQSAVAGVAQTPIRYRVIAWFSSAAAIAYLCRTCLSVAEIEVRETLQLTEEQMGWILGPAFFWVYALGQIPMGWLGTRMGARLLIPLLACVWSMGTMCMGLSGSMAAIVGFYALVGIAQAGLFPAATSGFSVWLPTTERGLGSGILGASMSLGGAIAGALTGRLLLKMEWQTIFQLYGVVGLFWAAGFYWNYRNCPEEHAGVSERERALIRGKVCADDATSAKSGSSDAGAGSDRTAEGKIFAQLMQSPAMWCICGQQFCRAAAYQFFFTWFVTWLREARGMSVEASGALMTLPLLATVVSAMTGGWASDLILRRTGSLRWSRQGISAVTLVLSACLAVAAIAIPETRLAVVVLSLAVFCANIAAPCSYAVTIDLGGRHVALVFAVMNMVGNFGAGWLPWFVPRLREWVDRDPWLVQWLGGSSWNAVLLLVGLLNLLAAVAWLLLRSDRDVLGRTLMRGREQQ